MRLSLRHGANPSCLVCPVCERDTGHTLDLGYANLYVCECGQRMLTPDIPRRSHQCVRCRGIDTYQLMEEDAPADPYVAAERPCDFCRAAELLLHSIHRREEGRIRVARLEREDETVINYVSAIIDQPRSVVLDGGEKYPLLHGMRILVDDSKQPWVWQRVIETGVDAWVEVTMEVPGRVSRLACREKQDEQEYPEEEAH